MKAKLLMAHLDSVPHVHFCFGLLRLNGFVCWIEFNNCESSSLLGFFEGLKLAEKSVALRKFMQIQESNYKLWLSPAQTFLNLERGCISYKGQDGLFRADESLDLTGERLFWVWKPLEIIWYSSCFKSAQHKSAIPYA